MIRPIEKKDVPFVLAIYNYYIKNTVITFEEVEIDAAEMQRRVDEITMSYPWVVYEEGGEIHGYAYVSPWKTRSAYRYSAESTIYLHPERTGNGTGYKLYGHLIEEARKKGLHHLLGGIALPNPASIALHEKLKFQQCAHFKEVGFKFEKWVDTGYWELLL